MNEQSKISQTAIIHQNVYFIGQCEVGDGTEIFPNTTIENSKIGSGCIIKSSHIENSIVKNNVQIGPFAHLRPNSIIENNCKIGNFVEIKNSTIGEQTKVSHLAYVGDTDIGKNCNIGCGAIFVNYNGKTKQRTIVEEGCFIGSNCNIVAPVVIGKNAYICAGTTLTVNTQPYDFVVGRCRETIKSGRAKNYLKEQI